MRVFLILALSVQLWASQSLVLVGTDRNSGNIPNTGTYSAITDYQLSCEISNYVQDSVNTVRIFQMRGGSADMQVTVDTSGNLGFTGPNNNENATVSLSTILASGRSTFRFTAQRDTATGLYRLKAGSEEADLSVTGQGSIVTTGSLNFQNEPFSFGTAFLGASLQGHIANCRWSTTLDDLTQPPQQRRKTSAYANLADWEFEGNLTDNSGNSIPAPTYSAGSATYATTTVINPVAVLGATPTTIKTSTATAFAGCGSFANTDANTVTYLWSGGTGSFTGSTTCTPTYSISTFADSSLTFAVTDGSSNTTSLGFHVGSIRVDSNGKVDTTTELTDSGLGGTPAAKITSLVGPLEGVTQNPWRWFDNRWKKELDYQEALLNTNFAAFWNTASVVGTVSVTINTTSAIFTGDAQAEFCGGTGNTTVVSATSGVYIWYSSTDYPGQKGRVFMNVQGCPSLHVITYALNNESQAYANATEPGLNYTVVNPNGVLANWIFSPIPANYYDSLCLAYYKGWLATGLSTYQTDAHTMCSRWWTGPNTDLGNVYNISLYGGTRITAGPERGQAATGLLVWGYETNTDVFTGLHHLWDWTIVVTQTQRGPSGGNIGNTRELGYALAYEAMCATYDTNSTYRANCLAELGGAGSSLTDSAGFVSTNIIDSLQHYQVAASGGVPAHFAQYISVANNGGGDFVSNNGSIYVTTTNGSPNVTLVGTTWSTANFGCDGGSYFCSLWFTTLYGTQRDISLPCSTAAGCGDTVYYKMDHITDSTHGVLTSNYTGSTGNHGMFSGKWAGPTVQIFQLGLFAASMEFPHTLYAGNGDTTHDTQILGWQTSAVAYVAATTAGFNAATNNLYQARQGLNCEPDPTVDPNCSYVGAISQEGESMTAFALEYAHNATANTKTVGDALFNHQWNPLVPTSSITSGFSSPFAPDASGTFLIDIADPGTSCGACGYGPYMIDPNPVSQKWLGFFFGYGNNSAWAAVRSASALIPNSVLYTGSIRSSGLVH